MAEGDQAIDDLYKENSSFLTKGLFGIAAIGIPLLLKLILDPSFNKIFHREIFIVLIMFIISLILQFESLRASDTCLYYYDSENAKKKGKSDNAKAWARKTEQVAILSIMAGLVVLPIIIAIDVF